MKKLFLLILLSISTFGQVVTNPGAGSVPNATTTTPGKVRVGEIDYVADSGAAAAKPCNASRLNTQRRRGYGNRGTDTCTLMPDGSTYAWVDDDPVVRPERFGWSSTATAADNATYLQAAVDAAIAAGVGVIEFPSGTFEWNTSTTLSAGNLTFRGQGQATVLRFSGSGPAFRNSDWTAVKSNINFRNFWLYAYGSAINSATSIGIDLSSQTDCVVDNVYLYNFGTGILMDGHRPDTATAYSTYYNKVVNSFVGATSDAYTNCVRGVSVLNGANSNTIDNLKTSRYTNPISLGDGSYEAPNQIEIKNPVIEAHLGSGIKVVKGFTIKINGGRIEGSYTAIEIADDLADANGIRIDGVHLQISGSATVIDTANPSVVKDGGAYFNYHFQRAGIGESTGNLIPNGNMEGWGNTGTAVLLGWIGTASSTWSGNTAIIRTTDPVKSGTYAAAFPATANLGIASQIVPIRGGKPYTFSYYSTATSTSNGHRFAFRFWDAAGAEITSGWDDPSYFGVGDNYEGGTGGLTYNGTYNAWVTGSNATPAVALTWERRGGIFSPPATATTMQVAFIVVAATGFLAVDEVSLTGGATPYQAQTAGLKNGGNQTLYGNLTVPRLITADPSVGAGSWEASVLGGETRLRELNNGRVYYDAYDHVFNNSTGTERGRIDAQNGRFGMGTGSTVSAKIHSLATTEQLRLGYDVSNYAPFTVSSGGNLTVAPTGGAFAVTGSIAASTNFRFTNLLASATAPTVTSAGTSPSITANNGTAAFVVNVGTGGTATDIVLAMPTATTGWNCHATNITATAANRADQAVRQTASTTTSVTLQNQTVSTGAALAFTASDLVRCQCTAY